MRKKKTYAMKKGGKVVRKAKGGAIKKRMMAKGGPIKKMTKGGSVKKTMTVTQLRAEAKKKGMKLVKA